MLRKRFLLAVVLAFVLPLVAMAECTGHAQLSKSERGQFIEAANGKRRELFAQFLSAEGCSRRMLEGLHKLGASVRYEDERLGYVLVSISRDKLLATLDVDGIVYADTNNNDWIYSRDAAAKIPESQREAVSVPEISVPYPRVVTTLPKDGPYFAADEIGLTELWKVHPEADGRGVRVAVSDHGFDLLHPALQEARDGAGNIVPKIADLATLTLPEEDSGWVLFGDPIQTKDGAFAAAGRTWTAPKDGTYRFGIFKSDLVLGPEDNSHSKRLSLSVGVLWDQKSGRVWVDTDGDRSFRNQRALGDFALTHDIDWFGTKQGDEDNRIPFAIKIDTPQNAVYLRIGGEHGALVGGPLAANRLTAGLFDGAAPSAQLIDDNLVGLSYLASIVRMFGRPDVDVINRSGGIAYDGETFVRKVLERAVRVYDKPMACFCVARGTFFVGDYQSAEMLRRDRQLSPPYGEAMNSGVWFESDGLVNWILAPSTNLETDSRYDPQDITWTDGKRHSFSDDRYNPPAPDGYVIGANNSPTIPVVSGVLADLISEARREHLRYNVTRLENAVFTGTRLVAGFPVSNQGYGVINAATAWDQLLKMAKADDPTNPELTSFSLSRFEDGRHAQVNGFAEDFPKAGGQVKRELWITRHGGFAGARGFKLGLRGNDGTYTFVDKKILLVRDQLTVVPFFAKVTGGHHVAFLELEDAKANVVMQDIPLSIRAPNVSEVIASGVEQLRATVAPLHIDLRQVRLGEEVQAARFQMHIPYTGQISLRYMPGFSNSDSGPWGAKPVGKTALTPHHVGPIENFESLVENDQPGTKEIFWENFGRPEYATQYGDPSPDVPIEASLTVSKYAVGIAKTGTQMVSVKNKLADVEGHVELFDAKLESSEIKGHGNHTLAEVDREVPPNLIEWRVQVTGSVNGGQADAYLLNCAGQDGCSVVSQEEITHKGALLVVEKPDAGAWKIVVRSREQVTGDTAYEFTGAELTPARSGAAVTDSKYASGQKWALTFPSTARYAAFRVSGTPGVESEKGGLLIAMTALDKDAP